MRAAVITDVHGNLPALTSVLEAIEHEQVDELWCLGDLVGYGADPDACAALIDERAHVALCGNHDLAAIGALDISTFSPDAADAARWTSAKISTDTRDYLARLQPAGERAGVGLYHASPRDPVWEYVLAFEQAEQALIEQPHAVSLIGHTHVACWFTLDDDRRGEGELARPGCEIDTTRGRWLLNPGSVGQPRDGDPRAAYLLLDTETGKATYRRVEYPIEQAAKAIVAAGLPGQLADRLYLGQ